MSHQIKQLFTKFKNQPESKKKITTIWELGILKTISQFLFKSYDIMF